MKSIDNKIILCKKLKKCERREYCDGRGTIEYNHDSPKKARCWEYDRMHKKGYKK